MVTYRPVGAGGCECPDRHHEPPDCACARALVVAFGGVTGVASADGAAAALVGAAVVGTAGAAVAGAAVAGAAAAGAAAAALADDGTAGAAVVGAAAARDPAAVVAAADEVPAPPVESSELVDDVPVASS